MTQTNHERYEDMAAAYALGALADDERAEFKAHLRGCEECKIALAEMKDTVAVLPLSVPQVSPPAGLRDRVLQAIQPERGSPAKRTSGNRVRYLLAASVAVLAVLAVSSLVWAFSLHSDVSNQDRLLARSYDALAVMARADQRWEVQATSAAPAGAHGVVGFDSANNVASVVMWGLDPTPGYEYSVWLVENGARQRVTRLYPAEGGFWALVDRNVLESDGIGVTLVDSSGASTDVLDTHLTMH